METEKYRRRSFPVDAVNVTETNIDEVAAWCGGKVDRTGVRPFIQVEVHNALTERQKKAFPGDWVLYAGSGYKVYTQKSFNRGFMPANGSDESGTEPSTPAQMINVFNEKPASTSVVSEPGTGVYNAPTPKNVFGSND